MKKLTLLIFLLLFFYIPSYAQEPITIYLPIILKGDYNLPQLVEKWKIISPVETTNMVLNPSAETSGNFSALGAATVTRSTTYQKYGNYSYLVQTGTNGQGISLTLSSLSNTSHFVTFRARGRLPIKLRVILGTGLKTPLLIEKIDTEWNMYGVQFSAVESNGRTEVRLVQQGNGLGNFYLDGIQVEAHEFWSSFCDGDQEGCAWNGAEHASTSTRSAFSRAGGQVKDLFTDYGFFVDKVIGAGATNRNLEIDDYALLPGGELNEIKIESRQWSLIGRFIADSDGELYDNRRELLKLVRKNAQKEPIKFLFYHPKGVREIKAFYSGGLEGDQSVFYDSWVTDGDDRWANLNKYIEKSAIQLISPDPYFYGQGNRSAALDANDSATFRYVAARLKSTGQWTVLGPPNVAGTYTNIRAMTEDETYLYIGGDFLNFDNIANADYIVRYNKQTGVYSALGTGMNDIVRDLVVGADGTLYAIGHFTTAGGVAANYIAKWNGSTWSTLGSGFNGLSFCLTVGPDGTLYAGGNFTTAGGGAANRIAKWNGSTWSALGTGLDNYANALVVGPDGNLYVGGFFTTAGGGGANRIAKWNGSTWSALSSGLGGTVYSLAFGTDGLLYAGGEFTMASWNGSSWSSSIGSGMDNKVWSAPAALDGFIYAGGEFTTAGGVALADRVAKWGGSSWGQLDVDLPGSAIVYKVLISKKSSPTIPQKYDIYLGFDTSGTGTFAGKVTTTNNNNVMTFPKFIFKRTGGTAITLSTVINGSTGKELLFNNYSLLDGERLTVDLTPGKKSVTSNYFGSRLDAVLPSSDFNSWILENGSNDITAFAVSSGFSLYPSSLEAFMQWRDTFESYD